jgi:hypothetical protein
MITLDFVLNLNKTVANFNWAAFREHAPVFRVRYAVTFSTTWATGFHIAASHGLTDCSGETIENVVTSI